jgi:very-short-patch-repair endonuclease
MMYIEVDGYTFHSRIPQQERDVIKDKVLALNGIELLRLSTRGYKEEDRIRKKLQEITVTQ